MLSFPYLQSSSQTTITRKLPNSINATIAGVWMGIFANSSTTIWRWRRLNCFLVNLFMWQYLSSVSLTKVQLFLFVRGHKTSVCNSHWFVKLYHWTNLQLLIWLEIVAGTLVVPSEQSHGSETHTLKKLTSAISAKGAMSQYISRFRSLLLLIFNWCRSRF